MQVSYGSTVLVPGGSQGIVGLRLNGESQSDEAAFFRAAASTFFSRGNKTTSFEFQAWWYFNTRGQAEAFVMSHWASLAATDLLSITCGEGEATQTVFQIPGAVLKSVSMAEWRGISVRMQYSFQGGLFASQTVIPPNEDTLIKRGTVELGAGATSQVVSFASSFGGKPVVLVSLNRPTGSGDTIGDWDAPDAGITPGGFTAQGQATPGAGYILNWLAIAP